MEVINPRKQHVYFGELPLGNTKYEEKKKSDVDLSEKFQEKLSFIQEFLKMLRTHLCLLSSPQYGRWH